MQDFDLYDSIVAGNLFMLQHVKEFNEDALFERFCKKNEARVIEVFSKIKTANKNKYFGCIGFYCADKLAELYKVYDSSYFINGLSQTTDTTKALSFLEKMSEESQYCLIRKSALQNNEALFDKLFPLFDIKIVASCIIYPKINFNYYQKVVDAGMDHDRIMAGIMNFVAPQKERAKSFKKIIDKLSFKIPSLLKEMAYSKQLTEFYCYF